MRGRLNDLKNPDIQESFECGISGVPNEWWYELPQRRIVDEEGLN